MTTAAAISFAGALFSLALVSRIPIWALGAWKARNLARLLVAHLISYVGAATIAAFGLAQNDAPQWQAGFVSFAVPALLVFVLDAFGILLRKRDDGGTKPIAWFTHAEGKRNGPLTTAAVAAALAEGTLKPSDWIWRMGFKEWKQIETVDLTAADEAPAPAAPKAPYLLRHWQGALSLHASFWVSGIAVALLFLVPYLILRRLDITDYPLLVSVGVIGLWCVLLAALLWFDVGIFRAARRHKAAFQSVGSGGAVAAAAALSLAVLAVFAQWGVPQIRHFAAAISETSEPRFSLQLLRDDTELAVTGPMDLGLSEEISEILSDHPAVATIYLNSPSGRQAEADRLAEIILENNLNTYVSAICAGTCVKAFAAGKNRWLSRNAVLALNRPDSAEAGAAAQDALAARTKDFFRGRGVKLAFIDRALAVSPDKAWRPNHAELFESGLVTSYATDADVALAGIPLQEIDDAEKALDRIALYRTLREKHPKAREEIFEILHEGFIKGEAAPEMRRRMWAVITPIVARSMASASDSALSSFYQVAADEAQTLAEKDAESCVAFLKGDADGFDPRALSADLQQRELDATAQLLQSSGSYVGQPVEKKDIEAPLAQLLIAAREAGFTQADFRQAIEYKLDAGRNCKGMILFLKSLRGLNAADRAALLRFVAQQTAAM